MILAVVVLSSSLAADVHVEAPASCVTAEAVELAIDDVGGLDIAELIDVRIVDGAPTDDGRERFHVAVDVLLARADPLHRELDVRPLECRDLPDLIALLVQEHRAAPRARPSTTPAPEPRRLSTRGDVSARYAVGYSPCDGPPNYCGGSRVTALLGVGLSAGLPGSFGIAQRFSVDATIPIVKDFSAIIAANALATSGGGGVIVGAPGVAWVRRVEGATVSARGTLGLGALIEESTYVVDDGVLHDERDTLFVVVPQAAVRAGLGWVSVEAGVEAHVTTSPGAALYVAAGLNF